MARGRATIATIAQEVGVSVPTVSRVLNGRSDVAAETRSRVEAALARYDYRKPVGADSPTRTRGLLDLVFHEFGSTWAQEIIVGVERAAAPHRVGVVLTELGGSHRPPQEWIDSITARGTRGVLLVLSRLDDTQRRQLRARSIPFVVLDTDGETPAGVPTVGSNNWSGGLAATRHLIELGHTRIGMISGPEDVLCSRARVDGFRSAHAEAGLDVVPELIRWGSFEVPAGHEHGIELLRRSDRPTAVFAGSDAQALGVLRAAHELGLRVPDDLSVVGYDDLPLAGWLAPALTTVRQPLAEMASLATEMLIDLSDDRPLASQKVELGTELIIRESTAPPR
ncbi:LacI family DNA-binding transcriptional regulator [Microbacterium sp. NPDC055683]